MAQMVSQRFRLVTEGAHAAKQGTKDDSRYENPGVTVPEPPASTYKECQRNNSDGHQNEDDGQQKAKKCKHHGKTKVD
jgi:hypothetical protein